MEDQAGARELELRVDEPFTKLEQTPRAYIGASVIGNPCRAYLAHNLRGMPGDKPSPRTLRIFRDGAAIEERVIQDLKAAGYVVHAVDPTTGKQWEFKDPSGHIVCHLDGIIVMDGKDLLLEIKSMNRASFFGVRNYGVNKAQPKYYDQMQLAMELSGASDGGVYVAYCKDTSEYYAEMVPYDYGRATVLIERAKAIVHKGTAPRITTTPRAKACSTCFKATACWLPEKVVGTSCTQCEHALPITGGQWRCTYHHAPAVAICKDFKIFKAK